MRRRGSNGPKPAARRWFTPAFAAALVAAIGLGLILEVSRGPRTGAQAGQHYALVLDTVTRDYSQMQGEAAAQLTRDYTAWLERIAADGTTR